MDNAIFAKMKVRPGQCVLIINPPEDYPLGDNLNWIEEGQADFVHLFVHSQKEFEALFPKALSAFKEGGFFWLSYPKGKGKRKPDINRDSLWDLVLPNSFHPVSQVALDETWSAIRLKKNDPEQVYVRPNNMKA